MRVTMKSRLSGSRDGVAWPEPGGVIDVPDDEAASLIAAGHAVQAETQPKAAPRSTATKR